MALFKRIGAWIGSRRIRTKLTIVYLVVGFLPLLFIGSAMIGYARHLIYQQHVMQLEEENRRIRLLVFDMSYYANQASDAIFYDDDIRRLISRRYENQSAANAAYRRYTLNRQTQLSYTMLSDVRIYVNNPTMVTADRFVLVNEDIKGEAWYQKASVGKGDGSWYIIPQPKKDGCLCLVRKMFTDDDAIFGVIVVRISNNYLNLLVNNDTLRTVATLDRQSIFYSANHRDIGAPAPSFSADYAVAPQLGHAAYRDQSALAMRSEISVQHNSSQRFQIVTMHIDSEKYLNGITTALAIIVSASLLIPLVAISAFSKSFGGRISIVQREMKKIAGGDMSIMDADIGNDELGELYADMRLMLNSIMAMSSEIYEAQLARAKLLNRQEKMKFEILTNQINPHYLFNTLESIRMKAFSTGDAAIANMIKLLGKSMRHFLEIGNGPVPLLSELQYIDVYFQIIAFRFGERIGYSVDVEDMERIREYHILPLLIQPIVENAVVHGLESKTEGGLVRISVSAGDGIVKIAVEDNGVGMPQRQNEKLVESLDSSVERSAIGLSNVQERIKLYYGDEYGLTIESAVGLGTQVLIRLPEDWRSRLHDETADH